MAGTHPGAGSESGRQAIRLSMVAGVGMLAIKSTAWWLTGSAAILSDAAESVVHVAAVLFAGFSYWLSLRSETPRFTYGFERIAFFSAGLEGGLILVAAAGILYTAWRKWSQPTALHNVELGTGLVLLSALLNIGLGWHLVRVGRRQSSLILVANGKHVLADAWTSLGVGGGLIAARWTGLWHLDPLLAAAVGCNVAYSGLGLVTRSVGGLLDYSDPVIGERIREVLRGLSQELGFRYHEVRFRDAGVHLRIELHLLFPGRTPLGEAHQVATWVERALEAKLGRPVEVTSHLEALEDHEVLHRSEHFVGPPQGSRENRSSGPPSCDEDEA
ncbi:MAG: cation diffusion facilitator family transporter [Acidobacteriota bacterium]